MEHDFIWAFLDLCKWVDRASRIKRYTIYFGMCRALLFARPQSEQSVTNLIPDSC